MPLSSSSLFHFTSHEMDGILNIIKNGFRVSYSDEIELFGDVKVRRAIPMVCFCDIPLTLIESHSGIYSSDSNKIFGIGMKKKWANSKGLNPVIYLSQKSILSNIHKKNNDIYNSIRSHNFMLKYILEKNKNIDFPLKTDLLEIANDLENKLKQCRIKTICNYGTSFSEGLTSRIDLFTKPVEGPYYRNNKIINSNYNFYNEREWRYIPNGLTTLNTSSCPFVVLNNFDAHMLTLLDKSSNELGKLNELCYEKFLEQSKEYEFLDFEYSDISIIIVDNQESVNFLIEKLLSKTYFKDSIEENEIYELISKIISWEQIKNDFLDH